MRKTVEETFNALLDEEARRFGDFIPEDALECCLRVDRITAAAVVEMRAVGADSMSW